MAPRPRLPELTLADAGKRFVMSPGSERTLLVLLGSEDLRVDGPILVEGPIADEGGATFGALRRFRVVALERGSARVTLGEAHWKFEVRGPRQPAEQTADDTDAGWGEGASGHSQSWWVEQQPPHWS